MTEAKMLTIDIETSPSLAYIWKMWDENVGLSQLVIPTDMICFAAKWYGKSKVEFYSQYHDGKEAMVQAAWDLIDEADSVIHFNGRRFDMPHLRREFLLAGLGAPSPVRQIDLLQIVRANFKFMSNKLDHVAAQLGVGTKTKHTGFDLWRDCMNEDPEAWRLMEKYNRQDVKLTEAVYDKLREWVTSGHPHAGLFNGKEDCCPVCGSENKQKRGPAPTNVATYQRYRCNDCGNWFRGKKPISSTSTRLIGVG